MNIKQRIGQRILAARKAKNLTRKSLSELTEDLSISRINNYERGDRAPGAQEIKQLSRALDVSPAYLMCLSDEIQPQKTIGLGAFIPILNYQQACDHALCLESIKGQKYEKNISFIPVSSELFLKLGDDAFAISVEDDSMSPELRTNDILLVSPKTQPHPGRYVIAKLTEDNKIIIRRYKQISANKEVNHFELVAINDNWANINSKENNIEKIIGTIIYLFRDI